MSEEYSLAVFEDGTTEMIPKAWIQDYLQSPNDSEMRDTAYTPLQPFKKEPHPIPYPYNHLPRYSQMGSQVAEPQTVPPPPQHVHTSPTANMEELDKHVQSLLKIVVENRNAINHLQKSVDRLICIATGEPEPEINLTQPAATLHEFLAIEEHIKIKANYDEMVQNLSKIGGKNVEAATRKVWNKLCTTQLASTICWTGANGKYCLKPMELNNLVRDSILITHPSGKEQDIQKATMLWFSHAQDRLRARKRLPTNS